MVKDQPIGLYEFLREKQPTNDTNLHNRSVSDDKPHMILVRKELKAKLRCLIKAKLATEGSSVRSGEPVVILEEECQHSVVVMGLCAHCGKHGLFSKTRDLRFLFLCMVYVGADLTHAHYSERSDHSSAARGLASSRAQTGDSKANVSMVHGIPSLMVSKAHALTLGKEDEQRWLKHRKLVLIVDLDQVRFSLICCGCQWPLLRFCLTDIYLCVLYQRR